MSYPDEEYRAAMIADGQDWQIRLQKTDKGVIKPVMVNAYLLIKYGLRGEQWLAFDEFLGEPVVVGETPWRRRSKQWSDHDVNQARLRINSEYLVDFNAPLLHDAVDNVAADRSFHPVRKYLQGLQWDGTPRIDAWLRRYLNADPEKGGDCAQYLANAGAWWLIGAVARVMKPGCRMDNLLIFEGRQGAFKSTTLSILGGEWFLDTPIVIGDKDAYQMIRGKWIVELAELDSFNKAESTKAKSFFSSPCDTFRASYGRRAVDVPRQCVFSGTTNEDAYLRDGTGNRRYWPVLARSIKPDDLIRDRDQLWAEAYARYSAGARWWPESDDAAMFETQQNLRLIEDPWQSVISEWLESADNKMRLARDGITTHEVLRDACKVEAGRMDERAMQMRVAKILKALDLTRRESRSSRALGSRYVYVRSSAQVGTGRDDDF